MTRALAFPLGLAAVLLLSFRQKLRADLARESDGPTSSARRDGRGELCHRATTRIKSGVKPAHEFGPVVRPIYQMSEYLQDDSLEYEVLHLRILTHVQATALRHYEHYDASGGAGSRAERGAR